MEVNFISGSYTSTERNLRLIEKRFISYSFQGNRTNRIYVFISVHPYQCLGIYIIFITYQYISLYIYKHTLGCFIGYVVGYMVSI